MLVLWKTLLIKFTRRIVGIYEVMIIGDKEEGEMIAKKLLIDHKESWHIKYMVHTDDLDKDVYKRQLYHTSNCLHAHKLRDCLWRTLL